MEPVEDNNGQIADLGAGLVVCADHGPGEHRRVAVRVAATAAVACGRPGGHDSMQKGLTSFGFWHRRIVNPILDLLRQGITPEKMALSIALGITLGITPVIGSTSILCLLAAIVLRLNTPAIQLICLLLLFPLLVPGNISSL